MSTANAEIAAWICEERQAVPPTATHILSRGYDIEPNCDVTIRAEELNPNTEYILAVAAFNDTTNGLTIVEFTTLNAKFDDSDNTEDGDKTDEENGGKDENEEDDNQGDNNQGEEEEIEVLDLAFAYATTFKSSDTTSVCNIVLKDKDMQYSLAISFTGLPHNRLIAGSYHIGAEMTESNITMTLSTPAGDIAASGGSITVERDHEQYTLNIEFRSEEVLLNGTYCGAIAGLNSDDEEEKEDDSDNNNDPSDGKEESDIILTQGTIHKELASRYWELTLSNENGSTMLYAEIYGYDMDLGYLVPGKYSVKNYGYEFAEGDIDYYYSKLTMDKRSEQLDSGMLDISLNDSRYTIIIDITDESGRTLQTTFEGELTTK